MNPTEQDLIRLIHMKNHEIRMLKDALREMYVEHVLMREGSHG